LSTQVHEDFEEIAEDAKANRNAKATLGKMATTMKRCISCHEAFRLAESSHSR
jgi:cytochrome c556